MEEQSIHVFLLAIREIEYQDIWNELINIPNTVILLPTNLNSSITKELLKSHSCQINPKNPNQLLSFNGKRMIIKNKLLLMIEKDLFNSKWDWNIKSLNFKEFYEKIDIESMNTIKIETDLEKFELVQNQQIQIYKIQDEIGIDRIQINQDYKFKSDNQTGFYSIIPTSLPKVIPNVIETLQIPIEGVKNILPLLNNINWTPMEIPIPNCTDPEFIKLIELLKQPKSIPLCSLLQSYVLQISNLTIPISNASKLDSLSNTFTTTLQHFQTQLNQTPQINEQGEEYINQLLKGLESYLTTILYDRIQSRFFKYENQLDLQLSRKLTLLKLLDIEACKLNQSNHLELKKLLIQSSSRLIQFEDSKTPTSKLKQLQLFIIEIIDYLKINELESNTDELLTMMIYILIHTNPNLLVSSLKFTQKLCFSPTLQGIDSFNLILLESCINWIINFEIGMDDKLLLKDVHGVEAGGSSTVYHDSILNELGQFATQVSKSFWSSDMIQFNPTNYTKTDVPLTNTFKIKKVDGNVGAKLREQLRTSK